MNNPITSGIHHAGFTVPSLREAKAFFLDALHFTQVGEIPDYPAVFLSDAHIMITLWQAKNPDQAVAFDRHNNIGLHHFALKVADLDSLYSDLNRREDTTIEFAPEPLGSGPTRHMICTIPGGLRVEFIQPANPA